MLALGFHSVKRALMGLDIKDKSQAYKVQKQRVDQFPSRSESHEVHR